MPQAVRGFRLPGRCRQTGARSLTYVSTFRGGDGATRDIIEWMIERQLIPVEILQ